MLKVIKNFFPAAIFIAAILAFGAFSTQSSAIQIRSDLVVRVNSSLSLIVPSQEVKLMLTPGSNEIVYKDLDINLRTNNKLGATVYITTNKSTYPASSPNYYYDEDRWTTANSLVGRTTGREIESLGLGNGNGNIPASIPASSFPSGKWGVSIDGGENYTGVPPKNLNAKAILEESSDAINSTATIRFGAKVSDDLPSDYYENTIIFTAVATYAPKTVESILYMQEIDSEVADSMVEGSQYQLIDIRDGKKYWVSRLADGNVWMTQNLDLTLSTGVTLTPDDTDIKEDWTPIRSTIANLDSEYDSWVRDGSSPYSFGITNEYDKVYAFGPSDYGNINYCESHSTTYEFCEHYNVGKYYNWAAAVAKNDTTAIVADGEDLNIDQSICPAGWKLPVGYQGENQQSDFTAMISKAKIASVNTGSDGTSEATYLTNGYDMVRQSPLFLVTAGERTTSGQMGSLTSVGTYWTSTIHNSPNVDFIAFRNGSSATLLTNTNTSTYSNDGSTTFEKLGIGRSVRCLTRPTETHIIEYVLGDGTIVGRQTEENSVSIWKMTIRPSRFIDNNLYNANNLSQVKYWGCNDQVNSFWGIQEGATITVDSTASTKMRCWAYFD